MAFLGQRVSAGSVDDCLILFFNMPTRATSSSPVTHVSITRADRERQALTQTKDCVIEETPVALVYNDVSHVVLLATPDNALHDLALGFGLSEGILLNTDELLDCECVVEEKGILMEMRVSNRAFEALKGRRRALAGRTGCGLCGIESLNHVIQNVPKIHTTMSALSCESIFNAIRENTNHQVLRQQTGATHSAAWFNAEGQLLFLREDVGRHNALDKLIGAMATARATHAGGFCFISSRASFEMVQKAAMQGIAVLVAASAPTATAIRLAEAAGVCLIGFARENKLVIYTSKHCIRF
ncbi:MAG: formate dehydrogenase accessory sulfurtransferase FdhD [Burkholderiales bacterium]|jgi:FdhD protein|nr:formate dehydrogenase accessory sulfurtransferase FdhD [Burkholderiales bacterium]